MIFVDTNVFMYAVGRPHQLQEPAREFFRQSSLERLPLSTSAEVLQELIHTLLPVQRLDDLKAALTLLTTHDFEVWPLEEEDVLLALRLHEQYPTLRARDLCHLASCQRRGVAQIKTFDRMLLAAFDGQASEQR